ncbi:MAG: extracellular solute-binding protein [Spirochaetales bacterium]|nr:extracellular solute-binding protein [Spirochaetales bacterium]
MKRAVLVSGLLILMIGFCFAGGGQEEAPASDGPVNLNVWAVEAAEVTLDVENMANWKAVEEANGVNLNWEIISTTVKDEQFNLMLASGDLPDLIAYYEGKKGYSSINKFGSEGAFLPVEDLVAEYAPHLKARILDDPKVRDVLTAADGHIYYIPMMSALNAARGWFIRYDWLDKVGMDVPTTTDELYDVLVAFRDRDPNGNGEKDEIPMVFRGRGDDSFYNLGALAYAFDADMGWVVRNGKVVYGPSEPQYKDFMAYIGKLYGEKLIDQELLTRSGNARDDLFGRNVSGAIHDWFASTASLNDKLAGEYPGFNLRHFAPPLGTVDKPFTRIQMSTVRGDGGWTLSHTNPDPVATIKMIDFLFSPEGNLLMNFGVEGNTYTMQNGKPVYTAEITKNPEGLGFHEALVTNGLQWKVGFAQDIAYEQQFANEIATEARIDYMDNYIVEEFPVLSFTEEEQIVINDKFSQIRSYMLEMTALSMIGGLKADGYDDAIAEFKRLGLDDVTSIYQAAYDRKN